MKKSQSKQKRKILKGTVVSKKMNKAVVVKITRKKSHTLYKKILKVSKKYKAYCEKDVNVGDLVRIEQTRPMSKEISWRVIDKKK